MNTWNIKIECAGFRRTSCDDGPGNRSVLFLQGCSKNCPGCQNAVAKRHGEGTLYSISEIVEFIEANCRNKKLTISGGEPLEQLNALEALLRVLKAKGFNLCVYTGWEIDQVPDRILKLVDYIKTGGFVAALRSSDLQYVGSSNQHMFDLREGVVKDIGIAG